MKKYFIHLIPILSLVLFYFLVKEEKIPLTMKKIKQEQQEKQMTPSPLPATIDRSIASIPQQVVFPAKRKQVLNRYKQEVEAGPQMQGLPKSFIYAHNMRAIKSADYSSGFGKKIYEEAGMVFFKYEGAPSSDWSHVAYDSKRDRFYPISSVLKIEKITKDDRLGILGRGHEEYYYHPSLRLLYLQNENGKLLTTYQELKAEGHQVSLEVLTGPHKPQ